MFLPHHCVVCHVVGSSLCASCAARLAPAPEGPAVPELERIVALFSYEGVGRAVIAGLKFGNHRDALVPLATMLAAAIDEHVDLVTWVPTSAARRRQRGYDQAELIARAVGRSLRVPVRSTMRLVGRGHQTGLGRSDRMRTAFAPTRRLSGELVAVVDDVRTTGASLTAAAAALRSSGAAGVIGATFAATPGSVSFPRPDPLQSG